MITAWKKALKSVSQHALAHHVEAKALGSAEDLQGLHDLRALGILDDSEETAVEAGHSASCVSLPLLPPKPVTYWSMRK